MALGALTVLPPTLESVIMSSVTVGLDSLVMVGIYLASKV
jgi:hypothetical protein